MYSYELYDDECHANISKHSLIHIYWQWQSKPVGDVHEVIIEMFYTYGAPRRILSDQGRYVANSPLLWGQVNFS